MIFYHLVEFVNILLSIVNSFYELENVLNVCPIITSEVTGL